jgi:hypothetical protein
VLVAELDKENEKVIFKNKNAETVEEKEKTTEA